MTKRTQGPVQAAQVMVTRPGIIPPRKVAIVGFTQHKQFAPFADPDWQIWLLNDLYLDLPPVQPVQRLREFQVHAWQDIVHHKPMSVLADPLDQRGGPPHPRDPNHVAWLRTHSEQIPVYLMEPRQEVPLAYVYPREEVYQYFSNDGVTRNTYFTNSISWMLALAIMELVPTPGGRAPEGSEIGVWGVDMMMGGGQGSEYGYQRPSCEWLLGWARGAGIKVLIPDESDLLKTAFVYGEHQNNPFRVKLKDHETELRRRLSAAQQQKMQYQMGEAELHGALNILEWIGRAWMPGDNELPTLGRAPLPDTHKELAEVGSGMARAPSSD